MNQPIFIGIDHAFTRSESADFTCIKFAVINPINDDRYIKAVYLLPSYFVDEKQQRIESISAKSNYDHINYQEFVDNGDLRIIEGYQITHKEITDVILEFTRKYKCNINKIGADPSNLAELVSFFNAGANDSKFVISVMAQKTMWNTPRIERIKSMRSAHKTFCNSKMDVIQCANTVAKYTNNYILLDTLEVRKHNDGPFAELCVETAIETFSNTNINGLRNIDIMKQMYIAQNIDYGKFKMEGNYNEYIFKN